MNERTAFLGHSESPFAGRLFSGSISGMDAQIAWDELGSPSKPGWYRFGARRVRVRPGDIKLANEALTRGEFPIFNATWINVHSGDPPHYVLGGLA